MDSEHLLMKTELCEIIPDNMPEWAIEAMAEGRLIRTCLERATPPAEPTELTLAIKELDSYLKTNHVHVDYQVLARIEAVVLAGGEV